MILARISRRLCQHLNGREVPQSKIEGEGEGRKERKEGRYRDEAGLNRYDPWTAWRSSGSVHAVGSCQMVLTPALAAGSSAEVCLAAAGFQAAPGAKVFGSASQVATLVQTIWKAETVLR